MQKVHNRKNKPKDRNQHRKMTPYALTGDKKVYLVYIEENDISIETGRENGLDCKQTKKIRKRVRAERRTEIHNTRQRSKANIRKEVKNYKEKNDEI